MTDKLKKYSLLLLLLLPLPLCWPGLDRQQDRDSSRDDGPASAEVATDDLSALAFSWEPGQTYTYDVKYSARGETELPVAAKVERSFRGTMAFAVTTPDAGRDLWPLSMHLNGDLTEEGKVRGIHGMVATVYWHRSGRIEKFTMERGAFAGHGFIVRDLLALMELPLPEEKVKDWKAGEKAVGGDLAVAYEVKDVQPEGVVLSKTYLAANMDGSFTMSLSTDDGVLTRVEGYRSRKVKFGGTKNGNSRTGFSAVLSDVKPTARRVAAGLAGKAVITETLKGETMTRRLKFKYLLETVGNDNTGSIRERFESAPAAGRKFKDGMFQKLSALFRLIPSSAEKFLPYLLDGEVDQEKVYTLLSALTHAGTPEAQLVLQKAVTGNLDNFKKADVVLNSLSFVQKPTVATEEFVRTLAAQASSKRLRRAARYRLGTIGHHIRDDDRERAIRIFGEMRDSLKRAGSEKEVAGYIDIIGNIGVDRQVSSLTPYLDSGNPDIRRKAYYSLRFVETAQAREHLIGALQDDDVELRRLAVRALSFGDGDEQVLAAYSVRLFREGDHKVVANILRNLAGMFSDHPDSRQLVDRYSRECGHTELCHLADSLLKTRS